MSANDRHDSVFTYDGLHRPSDGDILAQFHLGVGSISQAQINRDPSTCDGHWISVRDRGEHKPISLIVNLMSTLYAVLLVVMAFGFQVAIVTVDSKLAPRYEYFYVYLYLVAVIFLIYFQIFLIPNQRSRAGKLAAVANAIKDRLSRNTTEDGEETTPALHPSPSEIVMSKKRNVTHAAPSCSLYLRLGAIVFAVIAVVRDILCLFNLWYSVDITHHERVVTMVSTSLGMLFIFGQVYFIFMNHKLSIHRYRNSARVGMMHLVAANLCAWVKSVVLEEVEALHELNERNRLRANLSASAERVSDHLHSALEQHSPGFALLEFFPRMKPFLTACQIEYSIICAAVIFILWMNIGHMTYSSHNKHRKQSIRIDCSASSRGLFLGLFFVVITFVGLVLFFVDLWNEAMTEAMYVYVVGNSLLYGVAILACICCFYQFRFLSYSSLKHPRALLLDDILLAVALFGQLMFCIFSMIGVRMDQTTTWISMMLSMLRLTEVLLQTILIFSGQRLTANTPEARKSKPGREIVTFLLIINIALWLNNTFETQKANSNTDLHDFYGRSAWFAIVHSTAPLNIFYRFHSSVCLAEIWKNAYKDKTEEPSIA